MDPLWSLRELSIVGGSRQRRRVVGYVAGLAVVVFVYTVLYMLGMAALVGEPVRFSHALEVVVQSMTTTGYGEDADLWGPVMELYMTVTMVTGVSLIFLALPVFLAPWVEERLSTVAPTAVDDETSDHVVIAGYTSRGKALVDELTTRRIPYVVVEPDRDRAADLYDQGTEVVHGDPESTAFLRERAGVQRARAIVADVDDETNASIALTAGQASEKPIITFVETQELAEYHRLAGADRVLSPRRLTGESLAAKVTAGVSRDVEDAIEIGEDFEIAELPVQAGAELAGTRIADSGIRERTGVNVIGAWFRGEFVSPPDPQAMIDQQTILLVAGHEPQLEQLKELTLSETRSREQGSVIIGGYGLVGQTIQRAVEEAGFSTTTVDKVDKEGVDVVGSVTEADTLREAGIDEATTVILALPDDRVTAFATLVVRDVAPDVEVVARADATDSVAKIYQAGADYVLSLAAVSGRMLASSILDEDVISFGRQVEVIRSEPGPLAGQSLQESDLRARTGCTVVAVRRNGDLIADLDPDYVVDARDELIVTGTDEDINQFTALVES
jgi:Trk K+ transport system NAD-binding subunit